MPSTVERGGSGAKKGAAGWGCGMQGARYDQYRGVGVYKLEVHLPSVRVLLVSPCSDHRIAQVAGLLSACRASRAVLSQQQPKQTSSSRTHWAGHETDACEHAWASRSGSPVLIMLQRKSFVKKTRRGQIQKVGTIVSGTVQ